MWCRKVVTNPQISIPLVMIRVKAALLTTFLQAMMALLVHLKFLIKVVASTPRELGLSLDRQALVMDPILAFLRALLVLVMELILTFLRVMLVLVMDLILTLLRAMIVPIVLVKFLGKVAASSNRDLVTSLDMMVSVKDLTTDQVPSSEARAPPCPMLLAPKHQAKAPLSLTQPTIKHTARIRKFLKERACRAMAPRSLMILEAIRQVRGRSCINPGHSSLTTLKTLFCVLQARGRSRTLMALSSQAKARVLSLNNRVLT